jgi:hypothetical protein
LPFRQTYLFHFKSKLNITAGICFKALLRRQVFKNASGKFRVENVEKTGNHYLNRVEAVQDEDGISVVPPDQGGALDLSFYTNKF